MWGELRVRRAVLAGEEEKKTRSKNASRCPVSVFTPMVILGIASQKAETMHMKDKKGWKECDLLARYKQREDIQAGRLEMTISSWPRRPDGHGRGKGWYEAT